MHVQIVGNGHNWKAICGGQVVAWGEFYSDVLAICKENGWEIVR